MGPNEISELYSGTSGRNQGEEYLKREGLLELLDMGGDDDRIPPNFGDLARLHHLIRARKVITVLEFGIGYSTIVMSDALLRNRNDWEALEQKPAIVNSTPFTLHSVDTESRWIEVVRRDFPDHLKSIASLLKSGATAGEFQGRSCHFYDELPDIVPDFIYLDGPDPRGVKSDNNKNGWGNPDKVVLAADVLRMEPWLLPGTCVVVDGRTANVRFLLAHLYRNWQANRSETGDVTILELQEAPLGQRNRNIMRYCLGERFEAW